MGTAPAAAAAAAAAAGAPQHGKAEGGRGRSECSGGAELHLWPPLVACVAEERRPRITEGRGTPKFAPSTRPTWRCAWSPASLTGRAERSAARIARDRGLCLHPGARRVSGIGQGQSSTEEGRQRGAGHKGSPGRAGPPGGSRSVPAHPEPLAAGRPLATLPSHPGSQSLDQSAVGAGRRIHPPPPPVASLPPPNGSVECARAEPAASRSLPCQILLWRAAPSRAGGRRQPRLGSCPELPAPPRPELPGLGAAAQPSANKGGWEAPRSAAKYFSRPVGSVRLRPEAACRKPLGKLAVPSDFDP